MRLFEMNRLPRKAGAAVLEWSDFREVRSPVRNEEVISLPDNPDNEFFWLDGKEQFLVQSYNATYFGGTDEQPFLVQLDPKAFDAFAQGRTKGFYEALKPPQIRELETRFDPMLTRRQGDIFAFPVSRSVAEPAEQWQMIDQRLKEGYNISLAEGRWAMFQTRHVLTGRQITMQAKDGARSITYEGELTAPDHAVQELVGPHTVMQAALLYDPPHAD